MKLPRRSSLATNVDGEGRKTSDDYVELFDLLVEEQPSTTAGEPAAQQTHTVTDTHSG